MLWYCLKELARRCDTLIRLVEKENEEVEAAEQAEKKKSSKKTSGSRATDSSGGGAGTSTKVDLLLFYGQLYPLRLIL